MVFATVLKKTDNMTFKRFVISFNTKRLTTNNVKQKSYPSNPPGSKPSCGAGKKSNGPIPGKRERISDILYSRWALRICYKWRDMGKMAENNWVAGVKKTHAFRSFIVLNPNCIWPALVLFEFQGFKLFFDYGTFFVHLFKVVTGGRILPSCLVTGGKHTITHLPVMKYYTCKINPSTQVPTTRFINQKDPLIISSRLESVKPTYPHQKNSCSWNIKLSFCEGLLSRASCLF